MQRYYPDSERAFSKSKSFALAKRSQLLAAVALVLLLSGTAFAQVTPIGAQFRVSSHPEVYQQYVSVGAAPTGEFVIAWSSFDFSPPLSNFTIRARRFRSDGTAAGPEFQINSYTTSGVQASSVGVDSGGRFTVVWEEASSFADAAHIVGLRFDTDGIPIGTEFQVDQQTTYRAGQRVALAVGGAGDFVVVWQDAGGSTGSDTSQRSIQARRFASDGLPVGEQFQVNTYTTGGQYFPAIAKAPDGSFVVVWFDSFSAGRVVRGQRFDLDGFLLGSEFRVSSDPSRRPTFPAVSAGPNGEFVVVWDTRASATGGPDIDDSAIRGQRFSPDAIPIGAEFQVNTYTTGYQRCVSVAHGPNGEFVVVWNSQGSSETDNDGSSIQSQAFDADGAPIGTEFQVNTYTTGDQDCPTIAFGSNGRFVVAWESYAFPVTDHGGDGVHGRLFAIGAPSQECGNPVSSQLAHSSVSVVRLVSATDALAVLQTAVGSSICELCVCDVNNSGAITATDALLVLSAAVGIPVVLECPSCS